jgi:hypothetical protein
MRSRTIDSMTIKNGFFANAGGGAPQNNAPSSGDGASVQSAYDPNTGAEPNGYKPLRPSAQQDTSGANGGLGQSEAGAADIAGWHRNVRDYGSEQNTQGSAGFTI